MQWELIVEFVKKKWMMEPGYALTRETCLSKDLGIGGDDADSFIHQFGKEFGIDLTDLNLSYYFSGYNDSLLDNAISRFLGRNPQQKKGEITLGDLEAALFSKKMTDETLLKK